MLRPVPRTTSMLAVLLIFTGFHPLLAQDQPRRIRVAPEAAETMLAKHVAPQYPPAAREHRIEGIVRLQITIGTDGTVKDVENVSGHPLLRPAAFDAVRQWRYHVFAIDKEPVEVLTTVTVAFTLSPSSAPNVDSTESPSILNLRQALRENPGDPSLRTQLGMALLLNRQFASAEAEWRDLLEDDPNSVPARRMLASFLWRQMYKIPEAVEQYRKALESDPEDSQSCRDIATALEFGFDLAAAADQLRDCIRAEPGDIERYEALGRVIYMKGPLAEATVSFRVAAIEYPDPHILHARLSNVLESLVNLPAALAEAREVVSLQPSDATASARVAMLEGRMKQAGRRAAALNTYSSIHPQDALAYSPWVNSLALGLGDVDSALDVARRWCQLAPKQPEACGRFSALLIESRGPIRTAEELGAWLRVNPDSGGAAFALANILARMGRVTEALPVAKEAAEKLPSFAAAQNFYSNLAAAVGDRTTAMAARQRAVELERNNATEPSPSPELSAVLRGDQSESPTPEDLSEPEKLAVRMLRVLNTACFSYSLRENGSFPASLAPLGPRPANTPPTPRYLELIDAQLAAGRKGSYTFLYAPAAPDASGKVRGYTIRAEPAGEFSGRYFFVDQTALIRFSKAGPAGLSSPPLP